MNKFFAQPKNILNIHECSFYHTIELPTYGVIKGLWDLRAGIDAYIGKIDVKGKSFLDIGAASGFVCFEMEKKGAKVTGYDLSENDEADLIPWGGSIDSAIVMRNQQSKKKVDNSFWFSHRLLQSSVKMVYGSIYDIPPEIGMFDISFLGCILLHLRDPFLALQKAATITKETIIVTDLVPSGFISCDRTIKLRLKSSLQILLFKFKDMFNINPIEFAPNPPAREPLNIWWYYSPRMICRFLKVLGFQNTFISYHYQKFVPSNSYVYLYSVVGKK